MKSYELMAIFPLDEEKFQKDLEKLKGVFQEFAVEIVEERIFKDGQLAYPIKDETKGRYYLMVVKFSPSRYVELDKKLRLADCTLRHMFVKLSDKNE